MTQTPTKRSGKQLQEAVRALRGHLRSHLAPGEQLPNEQTLAKMFSVSRATIREAVSTLVCDGLLDKRWGVGTFARESELLGNLGLLALRPGVASNLSLLGGEVSVPFGRLERGPPDAATFPDFPDCRTATLERVYAIDGIPVVYARETLIAEYLDRVVEFDDDWTRLLALDLLEHVGITLDKVNMRLTSVLGTGIDAERLKVEVGQPVLVAKGQALDEDERKLLHVRNVVRTDVVRTVVSCGLCSDRRAADREEAG